MFRPHEKRANRWSLAGRDQVLVQFTNGSCSVLVATDVAARGIDIAQLPVVVNHDLPRSTVDYVTTSAALRAPAQQGWR